MVVEIDIIDRIYSGMEKFCEVNNIDIVEYMQDAVIDRYNLDKYGDLNEKLIKKENKQEKKEEPSIRPLLNPVHEVLSDDVKTNLTNVYKEIAETELSDVKEEEVNKITMPEPEIKVETVKINEENPKRTRRTLKVK